ncbi:MAG TPA: OsmC family protein [Thermodesulfobacteriota bacterium]
MGEGTIRTIVGRERGYRFRIRFDQAGVPDLVTDEPPPLGNGEGPNPARLLAAAVGNCLAASLLFCLTRARIEVGGLTATVDATLGRNEQGRLRVTGMRVVLAPEVPAEARDRMARCLEIFESFCIVTESVRKGIDVTVEVEPVAGGADRTP